MAAAMDVSQKHPLYGRYSKVYEMVKAAISGGVDIKAGRERYLPHPCPGEMTSPDPAVQKAASERYEAYIQRARFMNATGRTSNGMLGIAFSKAVALQLSGALSTLKDDADGNEKPLEQLLRNMLGECLATGRGFLLASHTGAGTEAVPAKPILKFYGAEQIINWKVMKGKTQLVVLYEQEDGGDEESFIHTQRNIWTELRMIKGHAYARQWYNEVSTSGNADSAGATQTELILLTDKSGAPLKEIPGYWLGSVDNDADIDPAPLADIADLNISHYQADADVCEQAHIAGQPTVWAAGVQQAWAKDVLKNGIKLGSTTGIILNQGATIGILQANETSMSTALKETRAKEMGQLGAKLLERGSAAKTATQANYEGETDNSILSLCASNVERCANSALQALAWMLGGEGRIDIAKAYGLATLDPATLTALLAQYQAGVLSLQNLIKWQQSIGLVPDDQTVEAVEDELRNAVPLPASVMTDASTNTDPNADNPDNNNDDA